MAPPAPATRGPASVATAEGLAVAAPPPTKARDRVSAVLFPIATFAVLLLAWQFLVRLFGVPEYILPVPTEFLHKLVEARALIWQHTLVTASEVVLGFLFAAGIGVPLGLMIVSFKWLERSLYPLIVFFQLIPKIAVAPLFVVWFGFGPFPKVLLTFMLCFFPTLVASMTGFRALDERVLYLSRSMGASAAQTFRYVRLPSALVHIFGGFKVSIVFAATGAIVAEFVGSNSGLGYLLLRATSYLDMPLIFAVLVALSAIGIVFSYAVQLLERLCMPWQRGS
ncbi:MAG: ABC transporter permease [Burkholderiales bacterium]|jgi:NitT/TauT family transport system permease protein